MKAWFQKLIRALIRIFPERFSLGLSPLFSKVIDEGEIENVVLSKLTDKLINNFEKQIRRIASKRRIMYIQNMSWGGTYFNIAVLNNLLGLVLYSLALGYIPIIQVNQEAKDSFKWEWYFEQPLSDYFQSQEAKASKVLQKKSVNYKAHWIYTQSGKEFERWSFLYQKFIKLNQKTKEYVEQEQTTLGDFTHVLGVLVRGTDYVAIKPYGHPVQPELEEVLSKTKEVLESVPDYTAIYVATEEERLFKPFEETFGASKVLSNKRTYYDSEYVSGTLIGTVHFNRENDNYLKGLEYLSSLILLSRCNSLVAGNCGGTKFALLFASRHYRICHVFDKGLYQ